MLLKRTVKDEVIEALYESSNIAASKYHKGSQSLFITFKTGDEYLYADVPSKDYHMFELAESQGKILNKFIKPYYTATKNGSVDVLLLKEQMESAKKEELDSYEKEVALSCFDVHHFYEINGNVDTEQLKSLQNLINSYLEKVTANAK